jgi:hypothetical protein
VEVLKPVWFRTQVEKELAEAVERMKTVRGKR